MAKLRSLIFPQQSSEARELYKIGQQKHGPLSRQQSESMTSYIQLTHMDQSLSMSDVMLGELLLEHAGLTSTERLSVMTSTYHSGKGKGEVIAGGTTHHEDTWPMMMRMENSIISMKRNMCQAMRSIWAMTHPATMGGKPGTQ